MKHRRLALIFLASLTLLAVTYVGKVRMSSVSEMTLDEDFVASATQDDQLLLTRLYPTATRPAPVFAGNFWASPRLIRLGDQPPFLLAPSSDGSIAALDLQTGKRLWEIDLPHSRDEDISLLAAPLQVGDRAMAVYSSISARDGSTEHRALVFDLQRGGVDSSFPLLVFSGRLPADNGAMVTFDAQWHLSRAMAHISATTGLGSAYVAFGGNMDQGSWHGWLFRVDLDAWHRGDAVKALASIFVTTLEADCDDGTEGKLCGGGLWAYAGPQVYPTPAGGQEIVVQSGNGLLDLTRHSYAQSILRLTPELKFDPACDAAKCAKDDPRDPSEVCLSSCRNLFVPRRLKTDPPLRPADGSCDGKSYLECLNYKDWDFGSTSPVRVETRRGSYLVTAGKDGSVYLLDETTLGLMYDRKQAVELCGTPQSPCPEPNEGLTMTQPVAAEVGGMPIVVIATFNPDKTHDAGVVAYRIDDTSGRPKLQDYWRVPRPGTDEAVNWFRAPPTRPVIADFNGEAVVWLVDNAREGRILGIRLRDGFVLANARTPGWPMRNSKPVIYDNVLYLASGVRNRNDLTWIEAYKISRGGK